MLPIRKWPGKPPTEKWESGTGIKPGKVCKCFQKGLVPRIQDEKELKIVRFHRPNLGNIRHSLVITPAVCDWLGGVPESR